MSGKIYHQTFEEKEPRVVAQTQDDPCRAAPQTKEALLLLIDELWCEQGCWRHWNCCQICELKAKLQL